MAGVVGVTSIVAAPFVLAGAGFGTAGVAAGSIAASVQVCLKFILRERERERERELWRLTPLSKICQLYRGGQLMEETGVLEEHLRPVASN